MTRTKQELRYNDDGTVTVVTRTYEEVRRQVEYDYGDPLDRGGPGTPRRSVRVGWRER